jgi:hypothetical protein
MTQSFNPTTLPPAFPDHTQLPDSDGTFVKNFQEHPQSILLTDSLETTLQTLHPDGEYAIGQDCGIYWRETDPPERGAELLSSAAVRNFGILTDHLDSAAATICYTAFLLDQTQLF